jgi:23S rRNA (uracil1939-C5)-methyltransferase
VEVSVHGIGAGGFGVGTLPDGKVVFLPRTAPGDRVKATTLKEKARWAQGVALEWIEVGPGRQAPPCPRYSDCDGCTLQHLSYGEQLFWKGRLVGDALRRLGGLDRGDPEVVPSPQKLRYRNKVTFTLRRLSGSRVVAGFRELGHPGRILDIGGECLLPEGPLARVWEKVRGAWGPGAKHLPRGRELRLTLRGDEGEAALIIRGGSGDGAPNTILESVDGLASIWRAEKTGGMRHLAGERSLQVRWEGELVELGAGGFLQVNRTAGAILYEHLLEAAGAVAGKSVVDGYCGAGRLGVALARKGARVTGVDTAPSGAVETVTEEGGRFRAVRGRVEEELTGLLPADLILLNPPRTGLGRPVPKILSDHGSGRVIYVSCDPATLARDLKVLDGAYVVEEVRSFDLFPQTDHVETVVTMRGKNG